MLVIKFFADDDSRSLAGAGEVYDLEKDGGFVLPAGTGYSIDADKNSEIMRVSL